MYVRKKPNRSGSTSVVIVEKRNGKSHYLKTIGVSSDPVEVDNLYLQGKRWIVEQTSGRDMFLEQIRQEEEKLAVEGLLNKIEHILINGTQLILNPVYQNIGFDKINDDVLKHLVVSRICQPQSKVATSDYLKSYFDEDVDLNKIYRYLDKLSDTQKDKIQEISVNHTRKVLGGSIGVVFYDVTTLYFETDEDDELRKKGWSKDGKHSQPQVVLGLLVSKGGYPLAYSIHEGNKYEGHTMLPIVKDFVSKFDLEDFIVVADSGLMNAENIKELEKNNYKYIIGARIKSENQVVREWILSQDKVEGSFYDYQKTEQQRLILGYTEQRARKDANNREKGIKRLEKEYKSGSITKDKINKRGYNKFFAARLAKKKIEAIGLGVASLRELVSKKDDALSLGTQCRLLNISKSGLYYTPVEESAENLEIMKEMDKRHVDQPTHGVLQMQDYLLSLGYLVNHKRVRRLMRKARIHARYPKRNLSKVGMAKYIHPYLLRGLAVERPGQVWSIDITYIPMSSGFMYLTAKHQEAIDQNCLLPSLGLYKDQYRVYTKMKTLFYLNYW